MFTERPQSRLAGKLALLSLALSFAGCVGQPSSAPGVGIDTSAPLPIFPSDEYARADSASRTGLRVALPEGILSDPLFAAYPDVVAEIESLDGFGTSADLWVRFDGPIDPGTLPSRQESVLEDSAVQLLRLADGEREEVTLHYEFQTLFIRPWKPLRPSTAYALALTDRLRGIHGGALRRAKIDLPAGVLPGNTVAAVKFTTQSIGDTLPTLVARVGARQDDEWPFMTSECTGPNIAWAGRGYVRSMDYRTEEDRFAESLDDVIVEGRAIEVRLPYRMILPRAAVGAPTVIVQHGLTNTKEGGLTCETADLYAAAGFATIAIDAAWHGERAVNGDHSTLLEDFRTLLGLAKDGDRISAKFRFARDAFRQTVLDHGAVAALIRDLAARKLDLVGGDGLADLSGKLVYNGQSMGGIMGSISLAVIPEIEAAVLNVPGGRIANIVQSSLVLYRLAAEPILRSPHGLAESDVRRLFALYQTVQERGDSINYARRWWREPFAGHAPRSVIVQETIDDVILPNVATEDLARAGDLPQLTPALRRASDLDAVEVPADGLRENLGRGIAGGMAQFKEVTVSGETVSATHGTMPSAEANAQASSFFHSVLAGKPTITR